MTVFAKKLVLTVSLVVLLVIVVSQISSGVVLGTAILRSIELTFMFWLVVSVATCFFS